MTATELFLDGNQIRSAADFHEKVDALARSIGFVGYGRNLDALQDTLIGIFDPPVKVRWANASLSRQEMGADFDRIASVLFDTQAEVGPAMLCVELED